MAGDDPVREAEKRAIQEGQEKAAQRGGAEWNKGAAERSESALSKEERAERAAVLESKGATIGCPFGGLPERQDVLNALKTLPQDWKADLKNPNATVQVIGGASRVGSKDANDGLARERAEFVAEVLRSDPDVKAKIKITARGFADAALAGRPEGKDDRRDRVVNLVISAPYKESVQRSGRAGEEAKPAREKEEAPEGLDERDEPVIIEEDWNDDAVERKEAPLSKVEQAERAAIAKPRDGIGCPFGQVPDRKSMETAFARLSPEKKALLRNPDAVVRLTGMASRVGSQESNQQLSKDRADTVAEFLRSDPQVKAKIETDAQGFDTAVNDGHAADKDNREDRIVMIEIELEGRGAREKSTQASAQATRPPEPSKEAPVQRKPPAERPDGSDKLKTQIPSEYTQGYRISRAEAEKILRGDARWREAIMGLWPPTFAASVVIQATQAGEHEKEMEAAKGVDEKLWGIQPQGLFLQELRKPNGMEEWKIKNWLREGGYDTGKMFKEYCIHWIRKGAR